MVKHLILGLLSFLALGASGLFGAFGMAFTGFEADVETFRSPGSKLKTIDGGIIASATLIAPTGYQTRVSGTTAIDTVQLPYDGFEGDIVLIPTGLWSTTTSGNIALATTGVVSKALHLTYSQRTGKWYPSY